VRTDELRANGKPSDISADRNDGDRKPFGVARVVQDGSFS
jgi:hypothetical protein